MESQSKYERTFSFEFFPAEDAGGQGAAARDLETARAAPAQVLLGDLRRRRLDAGGHAGDGDSRSAPPGSTPRRTCRASRRRRDELKAQLERYRASGIRHIVALRGDLPSGLAASGELRYANELVDFIRAETGDWFHIEVACYPEYHPQTRNAEDEIRNFKRKVDAGANSAITQYFYNADAYYRFVDACESAGIALPIVPGIMPIGNFSQLARFSDACGAEIPRWMRVRLESYRDDTASIRAFGLDIVTRLCDDLLRSGAPGLHFYTLNQAGLTSTIWQRLGL